MRLLEYWKRRRDDNLVKLEEVDELLEDWESEPDVEWGNCKRGCPPAYLVNGFCSPACELGGPRAEYVTVPEKCKCGENRHAPVHRYPFHPASHDYSAF